MANTPVSGLTALAGSALDVADYIPCLDSSASTLKKLLASAIALIDSGKTASFTAAAGYHYRVDMNGAGADFAITFPASPAIGDFFAYTLTRAHATYNLTINRNGNNVYGGTDVSLYATKEAGHTSIWRWDSTTTGQGWIRMNEPKVNVQTFTANGTWVKPPGAMYSKGFMIGGGGGGGSGRRGATSSGRAGGGGGAGGGVRFFECPASFFGSTESVTVGAGGTAGAAITADSTSGSNGVDGGYSSISTYYVGGGSKGFGGGTGATGTGYSGPWCGPTGVTWGNFAPGASSGGAGSLGTPSPPTGTDHITPTGGGGGGGIDGSNNQYAGATGGGYADGLSRTNWLFATNPTLGAAGTVGGGNGGAGSTILGYVGLGGGGGGSNASGVGGTGGAGGSYGGGGGGGAGSPNGSNSGAGGAGGGGIVVVVTFCR